MTRGRAEINKFNFPRVESVELVFCPVLTTKEFTHGYSEDSEPWPSASQQCASQQSRVDFEISLFSNWARCPNSLGMCGNIYVISKKRL